MRNRLLAVLRPVLAVALLAYAAFRIAGAELELNLLSNARPAVIATMLAAVTGLFAATAVTAYLVTRSLAAEVRLAEWLGLTFLANALNYLGPMRPGLVLKAAYLRSRAVGLSSFSAILAASAALSVATTSFVGLLALLWSVPKSRQSELVVAACLAVLIGSVSMLLAPPFRLPGEGRWSRLANTIVVGFATLRRRRASTLLVVASILVQHLCSTVATVMAFELAGLRISYPLSLMLVTLASLSNIFALTPSNLGVQELVLGYLYALSGFSLPEGLLGATVVRAAHFGVAFIGASIAAVRLPGPWAAAKQALRHEAGSPTDMPLP